MPKSTKPASTPQSRALDTVGFKLEDLEYEQISIAALRDWLVDHVPTDADAVWDGFNLLVLYWRNR